MDNRRIGRNTEPLVPRLMKGPDEEAHQGSPSRKLHANEVAHLGQTEIGAVKEDFLEDFPREGVERAPGARRSGGHDGGQ